MVFVAFIAISAHILGEVAPPLIVRNPMAEARGLSSVRPFAPPHWRDPAPLEHPLSSHFTAPHTLLSSRPADPSYFLHSRSPHGKKPLSELSPRGFRCWTTYQPPPISSSGLSGASCKFIQSQPLHYSPALQEHSKVVDNLPTSAISALWGRHSIVIGKKQLHLVLQRLEELY